MCSTYCAARNFVVQFNVAHVFVTYLQTLIANCVVTQTSRAVHVQPYTHEARGGGHGNEFTLPT